MNQITFTINIQLPSWVLVDKIATLLKETIDRFINRYNLPFGLQLVQFHVSANDTGGKGLDGFNHDYVEEVVPIEEPIESELESEESS